MNIRRLTIGLAVFTIAASGAALADGIYKWTDSDGNVHYEDRPSGNASEERLQFSYNRTSNSAVQSRIEARLNNDAARRKAREESIENDRTAAEEREAAKQQVAQCADYRQKLKTMLESRRLYREDENGERQYLDDAGREEARQKAEELIKENCSS